MMSRELGPAHYFDKVGAKMRTFKIAIAGNGRVGKTSLVHGYVAGQFNRSYSMTIGADFASREVDMGDELIRLVIWDLAGQRRFQVVRNGFYRGAKAVVLVYDVTNQESWGDLVLWEEEVRQCVPEAQIVVVGNKTDLEQRRVIPRGDAHNWAKGQGYGYVETSCATGAGVDDLFVGVAHLVRRPYLLKALRRLAPDADQGDAAAGQHIG
jgi:small GTP-binding protein